MPVNISEKDFRQVVRNTPLVSIDLIVRNDKGEVLLGFRKNEPAKNVWFVPGARVQKDEKLDDAFARITEWELGVRAERKDARFVGVFEHFYPTNFAQEPGYGTHYVVLAHELKLSQIPKNPSPDQHEICRWFTVEELLASDKVHRLTKAYFVRPS